MSKTPFAPLIPSSKRLHCPYHDIRADVYMTTHQQASSQPQQSHSSPQEVEIGLGLIIEVIEEVVLPGMMECGERSSLGLETKLVCGRLNHRGGDKSYSVVFGVEYLIWETRTGCDLRAGVEGLDGEGMCKVG